MQNAIDKDYLASRNIDNPAWLETNGIDALIGLVAVADRINKNKAFSNGYNPKATEQALREVYHEPSAYGAWLGLRLPTWMIHPDVLILLAEGIQTSPITTHSNKHSFMCPISCERVVLGDVIDQYREIIQTMLEDAYRCFKVEDRKPYKVPSHAKAYLAVWAMSFANAADMLDLVNRLNYDSSPLDISTLTIDIAYVTTHLLSFDDLLDAYKSKAIDEELFKDMICTERSGRRTTAQPSWALKLALRGWPLRLNLPSGASAEVPRPTDTIHKGVRTFLISLFGEEYFECHRDAVLTALENILYSYGDALWDYQYAETARILRGNLGYLSSKCSKYAEELSQRALADTFCHEAAVRRLSKVPMTLERHNEFYIKTTIYQEVVRRVLANDTEI